MGVSTRFQAVDFDIFSLGFVSFCYDGGGVAARKGLRGFGRHGGGLVLHEAGGFLGMVHKWTCGSNWDS
jgi:hypothetical protein